MQERKSTIFPSRMFLQLKKVLIENLIQEMESVVSGDNVTSEEEFENREKILRRVFLKISYYQDSDATNKINDFSPQCSSTSVFL